MLLLWVTVIFQNWLTVSYGIASSLYISSTCAAQCSIVPVSSLPVMWSACSSWELCIVTMKCQHSRIVQWLATVPKQEETLTSLTWLVVFFTSCLLYLQATSLLISFIFEDLLLSSTWVSHSLCIVHCFESYANSLFRFFCPASKQAAECHCIYLLTSHSTQCIPLSLLHSFFLWKQY